MIEYFVTRTYLFCCFRTLLTNPYELQSFLGTQSVDLPASSTLPPEPFGIHTLLLLPSTFLSRLRPRPPLELTLVALIGLLHSSWLLNMRASPILHLLKVSFGIQPTFSFHLPTILFSLSSPPGQFRPVSCFPPGFR